MAWRLVGKYDVVVTWNSSTVTGYLNGVQKFQAVAHQSGHQHLPTNFSNVAIGSGFGTAR